MQASISLVAAIAATGAATTIVIAAGLKGFTFFPAITSADIGDTLEFHFYYSTRQYRFYFLKIVDINLSPFLLF
jgi:sortase (surface protein transpeptidase)